MSNRNSRLFNRSYKREAKPTKEYVPLDQREWDGVVEVLPSNNITGQSKAMQNALGKPTVLESHGLRIK